MPTERKNILTQSGFSTRSVHAGHDNSNDPHRSLITPIYQTASYEFEHVSDLWDFYEKRSTRLAEYARYGTPTQRALELALAALDNAEDAIVTSSGMNAITTALMGLMQSGDHFVCLAEGYRGTFKLFDQHLTRFGIGLTYCDLTLAAIEKACTPKTKIIFLELPTNPYLKLVDLEEVVRFAKTKGLMTVVDATFASPYNMNPLDYGADLVVHSLTKYINGHNDVVAGAVLGSKELIEKVKPVRNLLGSNPDAHMCYLISRGIKTFALRMEKHNRSSLAIAEFLEKHRNIERVWYPMLASHPHHALAKQYLRGGSGIVTFTVKAKDDSQAERLKASTAFVEALKIPTHAASLGGVESLVHQPTVMNYYDLSPDARLAAGIPDNLVRLSVGIEDTDDLIADLDQALQKT